MLSLLIWFDNFLLLWLTHDKAKNWYRNETYEFWSDFYEVFLFNRKVSYIFTEPSEPYTIACKMGVRVTCLYFWDLSRCKIKLV